MSGETDREAHVVLNGAETPPAKAPFRARLIIWLIALAALAGIAAMCVTVLIIIAART